MLDDGAGSARATCSSDGRASSRCWSGRSPRRGRGVAARCWSPGRRGSGSPAWPPRWPGAPVVPGSRCCVGRSVDLAGTELPYQPFVDALRRRRRDRHRPNHAGRSQLQLFERMLGVLSERATGRPCSWCSRTSTGPTCRRSTWSCSWPTTSTSPIVLLVTLATDRPGADACAGSRTACDAPMAGHASISDRSRDEDCDRSIRWDDPAHPRKNDRRPRDGNPFFVEELAAGRRASAARPARPAVQRVVPLDRAAQRVLRLVALAGRDVSPAAARRRRGV